MIPRLILLATVLVSIFFPEIAAAQTPATCALEGKDPVVCVRPGREYLGGIGVPKFDLTPGARNIGMGRAGTTLLSDPALARLNPAALSKIRMFGIHAGYQRNADRSDQYNVGLSDSVSTDVGAALFYSMESDAFLGFGGTDIRPPKYSYLTLALSDELPVAGLPIMIGAAVNWLRTDLPVEADSQNVVDGTFGAYLAPMKNLWNLSASLVGRNLVGSNPERLGRVVEITGSIAPLDWLRGAGGVITDLTRKSDLDAGFLIGAEVEPYKELLLRGGVFREPTIRDYLLTAGIGLENAAVSVAFAYQRNLDRKANQFTVDLTFRDFGSGKGGGRSGGPQIKSPPQFVPGGK